MDEHELDYDLSPQGSARIQAVDSYLDESIRSGRPIEALVATRRLGEIVNSRAKQAARAATEGPWSWSDVGSALGMTRQAAHEKFRGRVGEEIAKATAKLDKAEQVGRTKIKRRADRGRQGLDRAAPFSAKVDAHRERVDEWEQNKNEKLARKIEKARKIVVQAERSVQQKLDRENPEREP